MEVHAGKIVKKRLNKCYLHVHYFEKTPHISLLAANAATGRHSQNELSLIKVAYLQ